VKDNTFSGCEHAAAPGDMCCVIGHRGMMVRYVLVRARR